MDVASTSGRISLSWTEVIYLERTSSIFSRYKLSKSAGLPNYGLRVPARAPTRFPGGRWKQQHHNHRSARRCTPATASFILRQDSAQQNPHFATLPTLPAAAAASSGRHRRACLRRILTASASTLSSYSPTRDAIATGQDPDEDGFTIHSTVTTAINGTTGIPHRLHHTLLDDDVYACSAARIGVDADFQLPGPQLLTSSSPLVPLRLQPPQAPRLNPVVQAALNRQIADCTDWLALEALYRSLRSPAVASSSHSSASSSPLGGAQLVAMARHLARLPRHRSFAKFEDARLQLFAAELAAATVPYLGEMAQGEYCALLWAYGKVDCHPGQEFLEALLPRLQPLLILAGPTGLSQALWGLARIGHVPPEPFLRDFYAAMMNGLRTALANPQHVSNLLWACVILRLQPPEELISQALAVLDNKLKTASPQALAITAWAVVQVGERPPPRDWWQRVQQAALQLRGKLQPQDISHLVWATARSGHPGPHAWLHTMCSEAHSCVRGFRSQEMCNLLWGLVVAGYKPPEPWLTSAISAAQGLLPSFKAFELAVLMWCLASLQAKHLLPSTFPRALFFHSGPKLGYFSAQDCANVIWSLARLQLRPPESWMAAFVEESFTQLPRFTPQHLANTLWGFARLSRCPPEPWMDRFYLESKRLLLSFKTSELAMLAMALGIARMDPPRQWMNQLLIASYSKVEHCSAQELANLVWGLWRLRFKPPQRWIDAVGAAASRLAVGGCMSTTDLVTFARAFGAFEVELPEDVRHALEAAEAESPTPLQIEAPGRRRAHRSLGGQLQRQGEGQRGKQEWGMQAPSFDGGEKGDALVRDPAAVALLAVDSVPEHAAAAAAATVTPTAARQPGRRHRGAKSVQDQESRQRSKERPAQASDGARDITNRDARGSSQAATSSPPYSLARKRARLFRALSTDSKQEPSSPAGLVEQKTEKLLTSGNGNDIASVATPGADSSEFLSVCEAGAAAAAAPEGAVASAAVPYLQRTRVEAATVTTVELLSSRGSADVGYRPPTSAAEVVGEDTGADSEKGVEGWPEAGSRGSRTPERAATAPLRQALALQTQPEPDTAVPPDTRSLEGQATASAAERRREKRRKDRLAKRPSSTRSDGALSAAGMRVAAATCVTLSHAVDNAGPQIGESTSAVSGMAEISPDPLLDNSRSISPSSELSASSPSLSPWASFVPLLEYPLAIAAAPAPGTGGSGCEVDDSTADVASLKPPITDGSQLVVAGGDGLQRPISESIGAGVQQLPSGPEVRGSEGNLEFGSESGQGSAAGVGRATSTVIAEAGSQDEDSDPRMRMTTAAAARAAARRRARQRPLQQGRFEVALEMDRVS